MKKTRMKIIKKRTKGAQKKMPEKKTKGCHFLKKIKKVLRFTQYSLIRKESIKLNFLSSDGRKPIKV